MFSEVVEWLEFLVQQRNPPTSVKNKNKIFVSFWKKVQVEYFSTPTVTQVVEIQSARPFIDIAVIVFYIVIVSNKCSFTN